MFRRSSDPLALSEASLLALRPAMNAPVLNTDFLPVGPARAAVVVFAEEWGGIGLAIGVRSNEGGHVAVFRNQEPIDASTPIADALEPALASAERMGFLFDEDLLESQPGGEGRRQAMDLWGGLMGEVETTIALDTPADVEETQGIDEAPAGDADLDDELLLDDVADDELPDIELDLDQELETLPEEAPARPLPPSKPQLSKFRSAPAAPADPDAAAAARKSAMANADAEDATPGSSELARIPLVRVKKDGAKRVSYIARLLSSF